MQKGALRETFLRFKNVNVFCREVTFGTGSLFEYPLKIEFYYSCVSIVSECGRSPLKLINSNKIVVIDACTTIGVN